MLSGGAYRRPGTLATDTFPITGYYSPRLIPFVVSRNESYVLLFSKHVGGLAFVTAYRAQGNKTGLFSAHTAIGTPPYTFATFSAGNGDDDIQLIQYCQSADILFLTHPTNKPQIVYRKALDTFAIRDFDYGMGGQDLVDAYPYLNQNIMGTTLAPSATSGGITLTSSTPNFFVPGHVGAIFQIDDGVSVIGAAQVTGYIDSQNVNATVLVNFSTTAASTLWWESAWSNFRGWPRSCCIFQQRLVMGGTTHQPDSIWFSMTANYNKFSVLNGQAPAGPVLVNGVTVTVSAGYINFQTDGDGEGDGKSTGPTGAQPFRITLSQNTLDQIQWLSPDKELLIGTLSQEWIVSPVNGDFSIANSQAVLQSKYGSDYLMPSRIGYELIFPMGTMDEVKAYQYNYIDASFFAEPVQLLFDEYPKPEFGSGRRKFRYIDWDVTRQTLWCLDTAGNFFGMTRDRKLNTTMWHTHQFGGYNPAQGNAFIGSGPSSTTDPSYVCCDGSVTSFAIVPNPTSGINDIWLIVKRTIDGVVNWQLERMIGKNIVRNSAFDPIFPGMNCTEPFLVDAAITNIASSTDYNYTGLDVLNGYSLTGNYYSAVTGIFKVTSGTVSSGAATLSSPHPPLAIGWLVLGLPFTPIIRPTRIDAGSVIGTAQGAIKRIHRCFIRFFKTMSAHIGSPPNGEDLSPLECVYFRDGTQPIGHSPELYTGDKKVLIPSTYERNGYLYITQPDPLPLTVISIVSEGDEYD